jgi:hypothetical protein
LGDFDDDGMVGATDLLIFLQQYACQSGCVADMDGDGAVTTADLLLFLVVFGTVCS